MQPLRRRRALQLGGLGLLSAAAGGTGLVLSAGSQLDPQARAQLGRTGDAVYHCHILDHEDRGMTGVVQARATA